MLLSGSFSWNDVFPLTDVGNVAVELPAFDEELFTSKLYAFVNASARHHNALVIKSEREKEAQVLYERLYRVESMITHLEGRCKCGKLVKANVSRIEAVLEESACDRLRLAMEGIYLQNTGNVFHSLYDEMKAELELLATLAPLVVGSNIPLPPKRVAPSSPRLKHNTSSSLPPAPTSPRRGSKQPLTMQQNVRLVLFVVNSLLDVIAQPTTSASGVNACKGMVLAVCNAAYSGILKPIAISSDANTMAALMEQQVQVKNLWRDFSRWIDVESALRSSATLEGEAAHIAHSFLLQRLISLGPGCGWAADMLCPGIPQLLNRWLNEALLGGDKVRSEEVLLVAVAKFPTREIGNLTPETVQSFVLLPVQKALEFYAEQGYFRLAIELSKLLVAVAQYFPMLLSKSLAILMLCPNKFLPICTSFISSLPWSVASEEDLEDLLGALLGTTPAVRATEYEKLSQAERIPFRVSLLTKILHHQQDLLSLEHSLSFHTTRFAPLVALVAFFDRFPSNSPLSSLIGQELAFFSVHRVRPTNVLPLGLIKSQQQETLVLFEKLADRLDIGKIGSSLLEMVFADLESRSIDAESLAGLMGLACFSQWKPSGADLKQFVRLASHRSLDMHSNPGADRVDALVEQLFLTAPSVELAPECRGWSTRNGGQMMMGVAWGKGPYVTQVTAALILISCKLVGMPSGWVVETLLSERMGLFAEVDETLSDADLEVAERLLHLKCPHSAIELEWRVFKIFIALHLTSLHLTEQLSAAGTGVFAKYDLAWLDSMGVVAKTTQLLSGSAGEFTVYSACRMVARTVHVMVMSGKSSSWSMVIPMLDAFLNISNIALMADKFVFSASIADAVRFEDPADSGSDGPSTLSKTLQFWAECLGSLPGHLNAVMFLENVLHSATAAGHIHWPVLPNASFEAALVWARNGKTFLAIAYAASIRPLIHQTSLLPADSACSALIELAVNVIPDKALALLCWDVMHYLLSSEPSYYFSAEQCERIATSCAVIEKSFPLGNPARRAYGTMAESVRRLKTLPATSVFADASVKRFLWAKFPPAYRIGSKGKTVPSSSIPLSLSASALDVLASGNDVHVAPPSMAVTAAAAAKEKYELSVPFLSMVGAPSFQLSNSNVLEFCTRAAHAVSDTMLRMEALEKDFIVCCRGIYQIMSSKATVSCGSLCKGGVEVSFDTMSQTAESLQGPLKNRQSFSAACLELWRHAAKLAAGAFLFSRSNFVDPGVALQNLTDVVAFSAEKLFPDHRPLVAIAKEALVCCGQNVETSLALVRAFLRGCKGRFEAEEQGTIAQELHGDAFLARVDFLLPLLVPAETWIESSENALLLLQTVRLVFANSEGLTGAESRRLLGALGFESALQFLVSRDECLQSLLKISCHVFASPEWSVMFMRFLIQHHGLEDAVGVAVAINECWTLGQPKEVSLRSVKVALSANDLTSSPPAWQTAWFDGVSSGSMSAGSGSKVLHMLAKALAGRRKPAGLIAAVRKLLPMLDLTLAWPELDQILRVGALAGESSLTETATLICKCAPDKDTAVTAWLTWFSTQVCGALPEDGIDRVLQILEMSWSQVGWTMLRVETILAFLREASRVGCIAVRRQSIFRSWEAFVKVSRVGESFEAEKVLPIMCWLCLVGVRKGNSADLVAAAAVCEWDKIEDRHILGLTSGSHAAINSDFLGVFLSTLRGPAGPSRQDQDVVLELLERIRDGCLKSKSVALSLFWMNVAVKIGASVPLVLRVVVPLCRAAKSADACKLLVSVCANVAKSGEDVSKLRSVLQTFLSSLADPQLGLLMLQAIPSQISNPKISAPLTEALLHSYLACATEVNALELAAQAWTPPSLPENSKDFPIHDVASATAPRPGLALTLLLILERQRLVSAAPDKRKKAPALWADLFACPSLASLHAFPVDPIRVFDLVGLWIWALQSIIAHFRPNKHQELSRVIIDFISLLDDLSLGYNSNDLLPPFLRDRMELAAGVCSMLAVRLTVEAVNGSLAEAGVDDRCAQLSARALSLKCKVLAESLKKPLHEVCTTLIVDVFPMGSYLARIVIPRRVAPPPALARASSVLATQANASTDPQEKK